jgi:uncharacterized membrane protein YqaE (UPF0057 family)
VLLALLSPPLPVLLRQGLVGSHRLERLLSKPHHLRETE